MAEKLVCFLNTELIMEQQPNNEVYYHGAHLSLSLSLSLSLFLFLFLSNTHTHRQIACVSFFHPADTWYCLKQETGIWCLSHRGEGRKRVFTSDLHPSCIL